MTVGTMNKFMSFIYISSFKSLNKQMQIVCNKVLPKKLRNREIDLAEDY